MKSIQLIDPRLMQRFKSVPRLCGVYFLFLKNELVYIGASVDIYGRVYTHFKDGFSDKDVIFNKERKYFKPDSFCFIEVDYQDLPEVEAAYILRYKPRFNRLSRGMRYYRNSRH